MRVIGVRPKTGQDIDSRFVDRVRPASAPGMPTRSAAPAYSPRQTILIVLIVAIAAFMQMLDASVMAIALPAMAQDFRMPVVDLGIGVIIYMMAAAIMIPISGWLADRFGARRVFIVSLLSFTGASILCGLSRTLDQFVAARMLQGMTGAVLGPVGSVILMAAIAKPDLIRMMNIFSTPMLIAPVIGPPLGGFITTWFGWPWIFYLNLPFGLAGALLAALYIVELPRRRRRFDLVGFMLNGAAFAALVYGFDQLAGGAWPLAASLGLALGGLAIGWIAVRHARRVPHALLSLQPVCHATFRLTTMAAMPLMRLPSAALPFVIPILLQLGFGLTAFESGLLMLGHTLGDLLTKAITAPVFRRFGYRTTLQVAVIGTGASVAVCGLFTQGTPYWLMMAVLFVSGCFRSFMMTAIGTLSYADVAPDEMTSATTLNQVVLQIAQALGVSVTVLLLNLATTLRGVGPDATSAVDCRIALVAVALLTLLALVPVRRLSPDAGAVMSGHRMDLSVEVAPAQE